MAPVKGRKRSSFGGSSISSCPTTPSSIGRISRCSAGSSWPEFVEKTDEARRHPRRGPCRARGMAHGEPGGRPSHRHGRYGGLGALQELGSVHGASAAATDATARAVWLLRAAALPC